MSIRCLKYSKCKKENGTLMLRRRRKRGDRRGRREGGMKAEREERHRQRGLQRRQKRDRWSHRLTGALLESSGSRHVHNEFLS